MTADDKSPVTTLRPPAVHASTLVESELDHTFDAFAPRVGEWWPLHCMSAGREHVRAIRIEPRVGGRLYETWDDGSEHSWGEVTEWQPPVALTLSWNGTPAPTEVEVVFTRLAPSLTRVSVAHRGWEQLTEDQLTENCPPLGAYSSGQCDRGWQLILGSFVSSLRRPFDEESVAQITDDYMRSSMATNKGYSFVLLNQGPNYNGPGSDNVIWQHGRRNFALRANGVLPIVCPILDDSERSGIGIFDAELEETTRILQDDPGVRSGVFTFEVHPVRSFPGDKLPA